MLIDVLIATAAQHPLLLVSYRDDLLVHDRSQLADAQVDDAFVWLLRENGTQMKRVGSDTDPLFVTYWITERLLRDYRNAPPKTFLVRVTGVSADGGRDGTVQEISYDRARALAEQAPPRTARDDRRRAA